MSGTLLSFGHGYSAQELARTLMSDGWTVIGTTRRPENLQNDAATRMVLFQSEAVTEVLQQATHILISAGPTDTGDPVLGLYRDEISDAAAHLEWVGYLSTTGVYGDHQGAWVDEKAPLTPTTERGKFRVAAEADWAAIPDLPLHVFRLAGIYGPGRGPFAKVRNGSARRIVKKGQIFSRIHIEDIAQTLAASIARPNPGAIYNLCDDDPAPPEDVIAYAAELLGLPVPPAEPFETAEMTPMARSFYAESKRVRNDRIKKELGIALKYPSYRDGLTALLSAE